jgi:hypothetical protein
MISQVENLTPGNQLCETVRLRRSLKRQRNRVSGFFSEAESNGREEKSKRRFRIDSAASFVNREPPKSPMRVLLRHAKTMEFLGFKQRWTKDPKQARDFRNGWRAALCAFKLNPRHLVIQYDFANGRYDLRIPVVGHPQSPDENDWTSGNRPGRATPF